jgi:hypothetical protein
MSGNLRPGDGNAKGKQQLEALDVEQRGDQTYSLGSQRKFDENFSVIAREGALSLACHVKRGSVRRLMRPGEWRGKFRAKIN